MFKLFLAISATFTLSQANATTCSCSQSFENFEGYISEITLHVVCPTTIKPDIDCYGQTGMGNFEVICQSIEAPEIKSSTKMKLEPWEHPIGTFAACRVWDEN